MNKVVRSSFLYFHPIAVDPREFAQCGTCQNYVPDDDRCVLLSSDFEVNEEDACNMYLPGQTAPETAPKFELWTPDVVGFYRGNVRCENCVYFSDQDNLCGFYKILNQQLPSLFDCDPNVQPQGCCNAFTPVDDNEGLQDYRQVKDYVPVTGNVGKLEKVIKHEKDGYHLYSEDGSKHLGGPYKTKKELATRIAQVEGHKKNKAMMDTKVGLEILKSLDGCVSIVQLIGDKSNVLGKVDQPSGLKALTDIIDSLGSLKTFVKSASTDLEKLALGGLDASLVERAAAVVKDLAVAVGRDTPPIEISTLANGLKKLLSEVGDKAAAARTNLLKDAEPPKVEVITKMLENGEEEVVLTTWIQKQEMLADGKMRVCGWGAVSGVVDNQGDIIDEQALIDACADWKQWGNIRLMHEPIVIGHADVVDIRNHPVTGTKAMWIEATVTNPVAIRMYQNQELPGFSIGGRVLPGGRVEEFMEVQ